MYRIGVDVEGTFTELALLNSSDGIVSYHKGTINTGTPPIEIVNCRVQATDRVPKAELVPPVAGTGVADALIDERLVYFGPAAGWTGTKIFRRSILPVEASVISGPTIVEQSPSVHHRGHAN